MRILHQKRMSFLVYFKHVIKDSKIVADKKTSVPRADEAQPHVSLWGSFTWKGQMRQFHKNKKNIWQFRLPDSLRVWRKLLFNISPTSILSAGLIHQTPTAVRRLFSPPRGRPGGGGGRWDMRLWDNNDCTGGGQQWLTAGFRPCDEVRPLCLTSSALCTPGVPPCTPCSPLFELDDEGMRGWGEAGSKQGGVDGCCFDSDPWRPSLSRGTLIISLSPDSCCPLNVHLSYTSPLTPLHPVKAVVLLLLLFRVGLHLVDSQSCLRGLVNQSRLTSVPYFEMCEQGVGTVENGCIFGNG